MTSIWNHFQGRIDEPVRQAIVRDLNHAGLSTEPLDREASRGPGLLFFDAITQGLCDLLYEVSRNGRERVLAIAVTRSALPGGGAWRLLQAGAADVFSWDHSTNPVESIAARFERWNAVDRILASPLIRNNLVGQSTAWISTLRQIVEAAHFTDASVLVEGESGTGKELVARLIHTLDQRPNKRELVVLDCTTIVPELSGSEFFGHERGAFTGAVASRDGTFALADGGTLFLDEVGDLPPGLQAQLLRVVQEGTYKRVGGTSWRRTVFRLVCATNRDLREQMRRGEFRRDLYYRIANVRFCLPPLRERTEDIPSLVRHFMGQFRNGGEEPGLDEAICEYLLRREYPGNVRDLRQLTSRILYRHVGAGPITVGDVPDEERPAAESSPGHWSDESFESAIRRALALGVNLREIGRMAQDTAERIALDAEEGNLQRAARRLGVTDRALQMRRAARRQRRQTPSA